MAPDGGFMEMADGAGGIQNWIVSNTFFKAPESRYVFKKRPLAPQKHQQTHGRIKNRPRIGKDLQQLCLLNCSEISVNVRKPILSSFSIIYSAFSAM